MELTILFILFTDKEIPRMTNCPSSLTVFLEPGQSSQVSSQPHSSKKNIGFLLRQEYLYSCLIVMELLTDRDVERTYFYRQH